MNDIQFFDNSNINKIAYMYQKTSDSKNSFTTVVYLSGFASNFYGTKATYLAEICKVNNFSFFRFDYSGTGESEGDFMEGTISKWMQETSLILKNLLEGQKLILVASSMGAWIALKLLIDEPILKEQIKSMIFIAPAPDFTPELEEMFFKDEVQKKNLETKGYASLVCEAEGYESIVTKKLIDDGNQNLVRDKLPEFKGKIHILQGMQDKEVPYQKTIELIEQMPCEEMTLELIKDTDHGVSREQDLERLGEIVKEMVR